jgi:site-specific DNA-methyltransferase (adenine-specific)
MLTITNEDNMALMARYPDKYFDLAIVDPPYGIKAGNVYSEVSKVHGNSKAKRRAHKIKWDDNVPNNSYFKMLKNICNNFIIWGANYYSELVGETIKTPRRHEFDDFIYKYPNGWIIWDKCNGNNDFNDCELAYTSFDMPTIIVKVMWHGMLQGDMANKETRIHPTQKPVALYKWLIDKYAKQGDKILDTHLGSGKYRNSLP